MTADQCFPSICPITRNRGSSSIFAGISRSIGSFQRLWASTKSMPCFARLVSLFSESNSNEVTVWKIYLNWHHLVSQFRFLLGNTAVDSEGPQIDRVIRLDPSLKPSRPARSRTCMGHLKFHLGLAGHCDVRPARRSTPRGHRPQPVKPDPICRRLMRASGDPTAYLSESCGATVGAPQGTHQSLIQAAKLPPRFFAQ